jgi:hypothetical protein
MSLENFVNSDDWKKLKQLLKEEFENKPMSIKTDNMSAEQIAIEVRASQIANERVNKFIKKLQAKLKRENKESWK